MDSDRRPPPAARWLIGIGVPALFAAGGALAIMHWLSREPDLGDVGGRAADEGLAPPLTAETPGAAPQPTPTGPAATAQPTGGAPVGPAVSAASAGGGGVPSIAGSWPGFRGARVDNISTQSVSLARSWGPQGPPKLWSVKLGEGYAGPAIVNSRVYLLDYDQAAQADRLRCFALATGQELWSQAYSVPLKRNHGFSRTVPAATAKYVVTLGPKCHVMCCDAVSGAGKWRLDLVGQFGATVPAWYAGQCPLIDGSRVILAPGGNALMIAVDLATGKVAWQTPNPKGWKMTHSCILPLTIGGRKVYVYCASGGVAAVSAQDGSVLWETSEWTVSTANVPTPVDAGGGKLFLCGGYNSGAMMLKLTSAGGTISSETLWRVKANVYGSQQHTPVLYKGYLYGTAPNNQLVCLGLDGALKWSSGSTKRFGLGPYMVAGGMLYVLNENGELALVDPNPSGYKELARAKVLAGPEAWGPLAIAGGLLLARDLTSMVCLDVRSR
ncbi:MAG: polyvinylalcohol dehydrogenase [Armatimonadetes bacterium]|nr:polyvinylalcohol dehydrogenase [Armatimonadota bacterium]